MPRIIFHRLIRTTSLAQQILPVTIRQALRGRGRDDLGRRGDAPLPKQAEEAMQRGQRPAPMFSSTQVALQEAQYDLLVQIAETAITARQPTVQAGDETEMLPDSFRLIALFLKQREIRQCIRTQWSGLQASNGFESNE